MIDRATARDLAAKEALQGLQIDDTQVQELRTGWFFPYRGTDPDPRNHPLGTNGVIVNKQTGARFSLGSAFPVDRDLALYDQGYQFHSYALVVTKIADMEGSLDSLVALEISIVEPTYEHGTVWRIPRPLTRGELRSRLTKLPYVFDGLDLYFQAEALEEARERGFFEFELMGCP